MAVKRWIHFLINYVIYIHVREEQTGSKAAVSENIIYLFPPLVLKPIFSACYPVSYLMYELKK